MAKPGTKLGVDEYYGWMFEHSVPGLPERAASEGLTPLACMRRYGAFEVMRGVRPRHEEEVPEHELADVVVGTHGRVYARVDPEHPPTSCRPARPDPDTEGRQPVGVLVDGVVRSGFPNPSGRLEFWSSTLASWGWADHALPGYIESHVHPGALRDDELVLISTFRLATQIHTRSANAKWLDELAHTNPLWVHPVDAERLGIEGTGALVRVETEIGHFVLRAWVTEGIRPGWSPAATTWAAGSPEAPRARGR